MSNDDKYSIFQLPDNRRLKPELFHFHKGSIQAFPNILVGGIWKFVEYTYNDTVSCKSFIQYILRRYICRKATWALYLYAVIEYPDMDIITDTVITMQHSISHDLVKGLRRILNIFKLLAFLYELGNALGYLFSLTHRILNLRIQITFNGYRISIKKIPSSLYVARFISVYLDSAVLG